MTGRFHAFNLAEELSRNADVSVTLHTTYPKRAVRRFIQTENLTVRSCTLCELLFRFLKPLEKIFGLLPWRAYRFCFLFFQQTLLKRNEYDVFIGFAGVSQPALEYLKKRNVLKILERGSTHILFQQQQLRFAHHMSGELPTPTIPAEAIKAELAEYELADIISTPTAFTKSTFIEHGVEPSKIMMANYGTNIQAFEERYDLRCSKYTFCFSGYGSSRKGFGMLLDATKNLEQLDFQLFHFGGISDFMERKLKDTSPTNILRFGNLAQTELPQRYNECHCLILPSFEEGFATVLLQAAACGLHIIATVNSGAGELKTHFPDRVTLVELGSQDELEKAMKQAISKGYGRHAEQSSHMGDLRERITWEQYAKNYLNVFKHNIENEDHGV